MIAPFDLQVRYFVYRFFVDEMRPPRVEETAAQFNILPQEAEAVYRRLHEGHFFFLDPGTTEIRMANPLSAVPTPFHVRCGARSYWANCAWDMLGIPAMLATDATIQAHYADTGQAVVFDVVGEQLRPGEGVVYFALPVRRWYDDLIDT